MRGIRFSRWPATHQRRSGPTPPCIMASPLPRWSAMITTVRLTASAATSRSANTSTAAAPRTARFAVSMKTGASGNFSPTGMTCGCHGASRLIFTGADSAHYIYGPAEAEPHAIPSAAGDRNGFGLQFQRHFPCHTLQRFTTLGRFSRDASARSQARIYGVFACCDALGCNGVWYRSVANLGMS